MLRSLPRTLRHVPMQATPITVPVLCDLVKMLLTFPAGPLYACVLVFAFFLFLRVSNVAPVTKGDFDVTRHFTRRDVCFDGVQLVISLK